MTSTEVPQFWSRSETIATPTSGLEIASSAPELSLTSAWASPTGAAVSADATVVISTEARSELTRSPPTTRLYPQMFEVGEPAERALCLVGNAADAADAALEAYGLGDFETIGSKLAQIAAVMADTHSLTHFNENFGAVVSFVRRAALATPYSELSREALNAMAAVLNQLVREPMLDLDAAADAISRLESESWQGQYEAVETLIAALLNDSSVANDYAQDVNAARSDMHA